MLNELCILFEVSPTFLESTEDNNQKIVNFNKMRKVREWPINNTECPPVTML